jgi:hypothetical protein
MNKRRRSKAKRRHDAHKAYITELNRILVAARLYWDMRELERGLLEGRGRGDDDGVEYGHPGDRLRGLE